MCMQSDIVVIVEHRCCLLALTTKFTAGLVDTGSKFTTYVVECWCDDKFNAGDCHSDPCKSREKSDTDLIDDVNKFAAGNVNIGGAPWSCVD